MFISVIRTTSATTCIVGVTALCFTLLFMNSRRRSVVVEWRNLPADILLLIAERSEIRHLRAVCSSWHSSLPLPCEAHHPLRSVKIPLPLFIQDRLRRTRDFPVTVPSYFGEYVNPTLTERKIYCLEPLGNDPDSPKSCWIVKLEEMSSGKMRFYETLSNWSHSIRAVVDFLDSRVVLVGKEYTFKYKHFNCKVVMSDDAMLCRFDQKNLEYFKFGDESWTMIVDQGKDELSYFTTDIIYHKQKFYVMDVQGQIIVFDSTLKVEVFVSPVGVEGPYGDWSFVQSDGDLFVVKMMIYFADEQRMVRFKVYRLNSDEQQWNEVTNLEDQSFFIGDDCTFSICARQFSGCGKNFIYCYDLTFVQIPNGNIGEPGCSIGIFNLEDNSSRPLRMISRYSRLFWPPPSWLKQGCFWCFVFTEALRVLQYNL